VGAAAFASARLTPAITGAVTDEQWRAAIADDLAPVCGSADRARAAVAAWSAMEARVDHEVVALLTEVRAVATLVLVSNATTRLDADLDRLGLAGLADGVVNTSGVGFAKPDPRIYRVAAERAGAPVGRCLFVDDTEDNVEGARAVGMSGLHYRTCAGLREALVPLVSG
jgi:putative hydrolase of the HAD superfamily